MAAGYGRYRIAAGHDTGACVQSRLPDAMIRRLMGILAFAVGIFFLWLGLT